MIYLLKIRFKYKFFRGRKYKYLGNVSISRSNKTLNMIDESK